MGCNPLLVSIGPKSMDVIFVVIAKLDLFREILGITWLAYMNAITYVIQIFF